MNNNTASLTKPVALLPWANVATTCAISLCALFVFVVLPIPLYPALGLFVPFTIIMLCLRWVCRPNSTFDNVLDFFNE